MISYWANPTTGDKESELGRAPDNIQGFNGVTTGLTSNLLSPQVDHNHCRRWYNPVLHHHPNVGWPDRYSNYHLSRLISAVLWSRPRSLCHQEN